jgi:hypothetical protein
MRQEFACASGTNWKTFLYAISPPAPICDPPPQCYDKGMMHRFAAFFLLLICTAAFSQTSDQTNPNIPKSFHDPALNVTYFYPGRFVPDPESRAPKPGTDGAPKCAHSTLFANAVTPVDTSSFVLSTIDNTCPNVLRGATLLGPFIREQILRQLKQYGEPTVTQEPTNYAIDGHPAAIVLASVPTPEVKGTVPTITYAAKACVLGNIPIKPKKKSDPVEPTRHVLCFDFTTLHKDLYTLLFTFSMQFDNDPPQPMVPGSVIR